MRTWLRNHLVSHGVPGASNADLGRACRATAGFLVALLLSSWLASHEHRWAEVAFAAVAAHSLSLVDVRGAYPLRFGFLMTMLLVLVGAAALGSLAGHDDLAAVLATGLVALNAGLWRHLSPEYGVSMAVPTGLVFLMALSTPAHGSHAGSVLLGGACALAVQVALWPVRAQHPIRRAVADSWLAAADLFAALADEAADAGRIAGREAQLRTALDNGYATLAAAAKTRRRRPLLPQLDRLHLAGARLVTRVAALHTAIEATARETGGGLLPPLRAAVDSLANTARSVALAAVSRQPAHFAVVEVRLRRAASLLAALRANLELLPAGAGDARHAADLISQVEDELADTGIALGAVTERAGERAVFPLELFDLGTWTLRPLAAVLNLRHRIDPLLARFTARLGVLLMLGVAAVRLHPRVPSLVASVPLHHGYWLPFTMLVVSQPDYGATRRKAAERMSGTLLGSLLGSGLLFLPLPHAALLAAAGLACFVFSYWLKRAYGLAVVFVTLFVVVLTEMSGPATLALTAERLGMTTVGGLLALAAAFAFWPGWERQQAAPILAAALRANRDYLAAVVDRLASGGPYGAADVAAKQRAEKANAAALASLGRMFADPAHQRGGVEEAAVLANANQRLTRALNLLLVGIRREPLALSADAAAFAERAGRALGELADRVEQYGMDAAPAAPARLPRLAAQSGDGGEAPGAYERWAIAQLARAGTELDAMLLGRTSDAPPAPTDARDARPAPVTPATRG